MLSSRPRGIQIVPAGVGDTSDPADLRGNLFRPAAVYSIERAGLDIRAGRAESPAGQGGDS